MDPYARPTRTPHPEGKITRRQGRGKSAESPHVTHQINPADATQEIVTFNAEVTFKTKLDQFATNLRDLTKKEVQFVDMLPACYWEFRAIADHQADFGFSPENHMNLRATMKKMFEHLHEFEIHPDLTHANAMDIPSELKALHDLYYNDDGSEKDAPLTTAAKKADFDAIMTAIQAVCRRVVAAADKEEFENPEPVRRERVESDESSVGMDFDVHHEDPVEYTFNRLAKASAKKGSFDDLTGEVHLGAPRKPVKIVEIANELKSSLMGKSNEERETNDAYLVFQNKLELNDLATGDGIAILRTSHLDDSQQHQACTVTKGADPDAPVRISTSDAIINSARVGSYTQNADGGWDLSGVSDQSAMHAVVQETLMKTSRALKGTKIDHRFVSIRKRDVDGAVINDPTFEQTVSLINAAITALQSNIIPKFDAALVANLERNFSRPTGSPEYLSAKEDYEAIKQIQGLAEGKKPADMKAAYMQFTGWEKYNTTGALVTKRLDYM